MRAPVPSTTAATSSTTLSTSAALTTSTGMYPFNFHEFLKYFKYYYFDFTNFFSTVAAAGSTGNKIILLSNKGQGITASKPGGGPPSIGKKNKICALISRIFLFKNY